MLKNIMDIDVFRKHDVHTVVHPFQELVCYLVAQEIKGRLKATVITFTHLADAFIQSDLHCKAIQAIQFFLSVCVFPGNRTHNLLRC